MERNKEFCIKITLSIILAMFVASHLVGQTEAKSLQKRSIVQLCTLVNYHTNRSCADYNDYGCFCGYGQEGSKPVDRIDACCKKHDSCYGQSTCFLFPQFVNFKYECDDNSRKCLCTDEEGSCARSTCECEMGLVECFSGATYNNVFYHMDRSVCK